MQEQTQDLERNKNKQSKFERFVRSGRNQKDSITLGFPNFFTAQKVRAKITQQDIKVGNKELLKTEPKVKQQKSKKSGRTRSDNDMSEEEDPTVFQRPADLKYEDFENALIKNEREKKANFDRLCEKLHKKMKFYQECSLNLMVFGVGSKRDFLNIYCH